ncbi:ribonuclease Z [uncultured Planktosalinus sp.]|uniref:ribonuclease Z n=1 Tax=uncultured Planktosalinus sp. TaxID=1810935 RepID=UPI0030DA2668
MTLTILGCHAATPKTFHNPTSQLLDLRGHLFLIDCGEGTQVSLRKSKVKFARVKHIFISHLHGDHYFGLIGLISTFTLLGREADLNIYGPKGIKEIITLQLKLGKAWTNYNLIFHELDSKSPQLLFEDEIVEVQNIPLDHRVYTNGFLFREKPGERKLNLEAAVAAKIDNSYFRKLKTGADVTNREGKLISNERVTFPPDPPKSYAFCSDTAFYPQIIPQIKGVSTLYHEATFLEEHFHLCEKTKHSTAKQAAMIARDAGVSQLILGHFSTRYSNLERYLEEAKPIFKNIQLAEDFKVFEI